MTSYWCEYAVLPGGEVESDVLVDVADGAIATVSTSAVCPGRATRLVGLTIPGMANCHSHAFHRALRGRTQRGSGTFWTWRDQMYALASRLTPDSYFALARATYREMAAAGITSVGEFHYLHHQPDGSAYDDRNAFGEALVAAAREAGIRIALLDTCYLSSRMGSAAEGVQRRFSDGTVGAWLERVDGLASLAASDVVIGAAAHSVRAVPADALAMVASWARARSAPLHAHLSEQVAENDVCLAAYGCTPTRLLADTGMLSPLTTVVHATHLTSGDVETLGGAGVTACMCPTTERDLGDGIGPAMPLQEAGCRLTLGSDSHAVVDPLEEMRALELDERLSTQRRGHWSAAQLLAAGTTSGHASLGFPDAGRIEPGARADLVTLDLESPRTAGCGARPETAVFAATSADVVHVVREGRAIAKRGDAEDVGRELAAAVIRAWGEA